jgi:hypothetical protein
MFVETEFLGLAQALEGFGRIRFNGSLIPKANYKKRLFKMKADLLAAWGPSELTQRCISICPMQTMLPTPSAFGIQSACLGQA